MNYLPLLTADHERFRNALRRFIASEVTPHADAREDDGEVPRSVLRQLGELGHLGIRYPAAYGGAELDTVYRAILAEELGRSTCGGFAVTVLVHTDDARRAAGRQLAYQAAWPDALGREYVREVSMVKAYCGELVNEVLYACQRSHGGVSYVRETAIERMARDARIQAIGGGATEVKLKEIAKRLSTASAGRLPARRIGRPRKRMTSPFPSEHCPND